MPDWLESSDVLAEQYADSENLDARIAFHKEYSTAEREFRAWQFDQFDCDSDARVLCVGCGPAELWSANRKHIPDRWSIMLTDFSPGMVETARENVTDCDGSFSSRVADASDLPFKNDSFDAATANHMLYHVPDREAAIAELRRVLKPAGILYATTNGDRHLVELFDTLESVLGERPARSTGFTLENGREQLDHRFDDVELRRYDTALAVTDVEPVVAYALSREDVDESLADDLRGAFAAQFEDGVFRVSKDVGMFVARG
jgi:ubiquinone/menaquinone biosynthesis C-methylase UbiE